jgi:hypothetical protein
MCRIEIVASGVIDNRDSAYPQAVAMPNGEILCSFSVGGGPLVHGGTDLVRSCDGGKTWSFQGTILPATTSPRSTNALKLSLAADGKALYAYGTQFFRDENQKFGEGGRVAVLCRSNDNGISWSEARQVPMPDACPLEVSHSVLPLASGRLLAPAGALPSKDRLGERVFVAISDDGGLSWPQHAVVFEDPERKLGFFEHKLAEIAPGVILATAWTVTLGDVCDRPNSYALSKDDGKTWSLFRSTGIQGQTMTAIPIDEDRLLILYNRRYGHQGIVAALVVLTMDGWSVQQECLLYDAMNHYTKPSVLRTGLDEFESIAFGFPTTLRLQDGTFFATYWCGRPQHSECRWAKLAVNWPVVNI